MTHHEETDALQYAVANMRHLYQHVMSRPDSPIRRHDAGLLTASIKGIESLLKARDEDALAALAGDVAQEAEHLLREARRDLRVEP